MKFLRTFDRRVGYILASFSIILATVSPAFLTASASAATVTTRSVALSTSLANASGVKYLVSFTPVSAAAAYVVDFCNDSPIPATTCTAPTGFSTSGVTVGSSTPTSTVASRTGNTGVTVTAALTGGTPASVELVGLHNPTAATDNTANNGFYARIVTFTTTGNAGTYAAGSTTAGTVDSGGVAMSITNSVGVTAAVLETMTFCVSGSAISPNCASTTAPNIVLGVTTGTVTALSASTLSTGSIYTQISTNAASGAIVNMKSDAVSCGGLLRSGAPAACDIGPSGVGGFVAGAAKFGVKTATATGTTGTVQPAGSSSYNNTNYFMNYVAGNATGVTSIYGDPFLDTNSLPANNESMTLTFGASISNATPAGLYSANLNMIATGKF